MIRYRNHGGDHFMLMPLERQVRRHERTEGAESMEENIREKRMARNDAGGCAVIHGMDGRGVFDGIELALRLHGAFDASVVVHRDSLDPGHSLRFLAPCMNRKTISNHRAALVAGLRFAMIC